MERLDFEGLMRSLAASWQRGDADGTAACFAPDVDYADPLLYRFTTREELRPFFEPGPEGHSVAWHRILFDEAAQTGVVEYTYVGEHRYHGAAIVEVSDRGLITHWREWQHRDDERGWRSYLAGPE